MHAMQLSRRVLSLKMEMKSSEVGKERTFILIHRNEKSIDNHLKTMHVLHGHASALSPSH